MWFNIQNISISPSTKTCGLSSFISYNIVDRITVIIRIEFIQFISFDFCESLKLLSIFSVLIIKQENLKHLHFNIREFEY